MLIYPHEAEWTLFQTHCYSENLVVQGIEPGTSVSGAMKSNHYPTEAVLNHHKILKLLVRKEYVVCVRCLQIMHWEFLPKVQFNSWVKINVCTSAI
jgi:hypothetical protein